MLIDFYLFLILVKIENKYFVKHLCTIIPKKYSHKAYAHAQSPPTSVIIIILLSLSTFPRIA